MVYGIHLEIKKSLVPGVFVSFLSFTSNLRPYGLVYYVFDFVYIFLYFSLNLLRIIPTAGKVGKTSCVQSKPQKYINYKFVYIKNLD